MGKEMDSHSLRLEPAPQFDQVEFESPKGGGQADNGQSLGEVSGLWGMEGMGGRRFHSQNPAIALRGYPSKNEVKKGVLAAKS